MTPAADRDPRTPPWREGPARPARHVPPGSSWAFREHRTVAEIDEADRQRSAAP